MSEKSTSSPFFYEIHSPFPMEDGKKYPVIFALHGIGHSEKKILAFLEDVKNEFILIGIRGHLPYKKGFAYYQLKGYGNPYRDQFDHSMKMLQRFIEYASAKYPIDPQNCYVFGFSQGAILSMSLALVLGDQIRGVVAANGFLPPFVKEEYPTKSLRHTSFFLSDGEHDSIFPPHIGREAYDYLSDRAESVKYITYPGGHAISEENQRDFIQWLHDVSKVSSYRMESE